MHLITIPQEDINSGGVTLCEWHLQDRIDVSDGDIVCRVETTKVVFEVESPATGYLVHLRKQGEFVPWNLPIGFVAANEQEIIEGISRYSTLITEEVNEIPATRKAKQLAAQYGIRLEAIQVDGVIRVEDVKNYLTSEGMLSANQPNILVSSIDAPPELKRILVIGAGFGAVQVIDILAHDPSLQVVGCVDDDNELAGKLVCGFPVLGTIARLESLYAQKDFDAAIISVSTDIAFRRRIFEWAKNLKIPFVNAIDPTARINRGAVLGEGNSLCSFVHLGAYSRIGDNNFFSAYTNIEHHNVWGSHNSTGPHISTSSRVTVGNEVKFGTGVFIQPGVSIGDECLVASGAIIIRNVPKRHAVKTQTHSIITPIDDNSSPN